MHQPDREQTILERLASRVQAFDTAKIPHAAIHLARIAIIDTIGVTLAGVIEPCSTHLLRTPGIATAPGVCTIFGTNQKTSALDATFVNGTASHALDYDDFSQPMGGHQSAPLVAPLMALAEERGRSGLQLIQSYIVGIETEIRLARAVNFHHYDIGWHPTATLGVFGAAAAAGHMLGLDEKKLAIALAIAASFASEVSVPLVTCRSMLRPIVAIALASASDFTSSITTSIPAAAHTCAMPLPIWPAPITPTVWMMLVMLWRARR